jgi:hypothetical protein
MAAASPPRSDVVDFCIERYFQRCGGESSETKARRHFASRQLQKLPLVVAGRRTTPGGVQNGRRQVRTRTGCLIPDGRGEPTLIGSDPESRDAQQLLDWLSMVVHAKVEKPIVPASDPAASTHDH